MKWFVSLVLTGALVIVPQSPASAACAATRLGTPSGMTTTYASHQAGTGYVVGSGWVSNHWEGVLWRNGVPQRLPNPVAGSGSNYPRTVNASGVIGGYWAGDTGTFGWRYANGSYQILPGRGTRPSVPTDINAAGDLVGFSVYFTAGDISHAMLWKASTPGAYTDLGVGNTAGIDDAGRIVLTSGVVIQPGGGTLTVDNPGDSFTVADFAGGRIVGTKGTAAPYTLVEWNLSGDVVRQVANTTASAVNSAGNVVGSRGSDKIFLSGSTAQVLSPVPAVRIKLQLTEDNVVVSDSGGSAYLWRC